MYSLLIGRVLVATSMIYIASNIFKKNPVLIVILILILIIIKYLNFIELKSENLNILYHLSICIIFYVMGVGASKKDDNNPIKQIIWISFITFPIIIMQNINFPEFISYYNTQKFIDGVDRSQYFPIIFQSIDQIPLESGDIFVQAKPSGLTWSNAYTGFLLNLALYLALFLPPYKINYKYIFFATCACIFCGSKLCIFGSFMLIIIYIYKKHHADNKVKLLGGYFFIITTYYLIFPALFSYNLSTDALSMSFLSRYYDTLGWFGIIDSDAALELLSKNYSIQNFSIESFGSLSSFNFVVIGFLVILFFIAMNFLLNKNFYYYLINIFRKDYIIGYLFLMGITLSSTSLAFNSIVWFFSGYILQKLKNNKSVL